MIQSLYRFMDGIVGSCAVWESLCGYTSFLPQQTVWVKGELTENGCLSLCVDAAMNQWLSKGVTCVLPLSSWDRLQHPEYPYTFSCQFCPLRCHGVVAGAYLSCIWARQYWMRRQLNAGPYLHISIQPHNWAIEIYIAVLVELVLEQYWHFTKYGRVNSWETASDSKWKWLSAR